MEMAVVSVGRPHHLPFSFHFSNTTTLNTSTTLKIPPLNHLNFLSSSSSSSTRCRLASVVEQGSSSPSSDDSAMEDGNNTSLSGCKACGREEVEKGCNGEGRIQGGIATFPGFGWWPIKAYRPCPGFVESGGRYKRTGQSLDEVAFGRSQRD
ncbi:uncharacterized protein LOC115715771 [Cannabis sativa]|uniref:uncharacterized protein LOC115715771 n=1 Tax=Cannabis sativa TaxID=3483 RepID=UPI0029CA4E91|nr:uncharacterized protein LOC115715771 [Cannabis sativa]